VVTIDVGLAVDFVGDDGRGQVFVIGDLPLPGWHVPLVLALAARIGPAGSRRTHTSATVVWGGLRRFVRFLAELSQPPVVPQQLTAVQVDAYLRQRFRAVGSSSAWSELTDLRLLFRCAPFPDLVSTAVVDYLARPVPKARPVSKAGYSDGEMFRLVTAARDDVAAIRDRLAAGDDLLTRWLRDPGELLQQERTVGALLAQAAETGMVPRFRGRTGIAAERVERIALARRLFVVPADREPLLVLLAAVTGRNSETLKELPVEHRILDGRAVELRVTKRRRGPGRWFDTVTWEIGPAHRQLHTPGGLYLLLHRLMARSRAFSGSQTVWSEWRNGHQRGTFGQVAEHHDPYAARLAVGIHLGDGPPATTCARTRAPMPGGLSRWGWIWVASAPRSRSVAPERSVGTCPRLPARTP